MKNKYSIKQLPGETRCLWHKFYGKKGKTFGAKAIFPENICPVLHHTLYPYFLGAWFGAKFDLNSKGDCQVCCPAEKGIDVIVKVRPNDGKFRKEVPRDYRNVVHAEVVKVHGKCDHGHKVGDRFVFPTCMKKGHVCPAGVNSVYPFMNIKRPKCINLKKLRCPDWLEDVKYSLKDGR